MEIALSSPLQVPDTNRQTPPPPIRVRKNGSIIPGFGLTMGLTLAWLSLVVLIPLSTVFFRSAGMGWSDFIAAGFSSRALAAYKISFGTAAVAALINGVFGLLTAWVLVRYSFPGKRIVNALVDLPFALPTAVAGIALTAIYAGNGWVGQLLEPLGIKVAYTPLGIVMALAALSLGARPWQVFARVVLPAILPALLTGFALAFARGVGEYGSVIFIAGNMPYKSEIAPLLIVTQLEQYDYAAATAIATVMLVASFAILLGINLIQAWSRKRMAA